MRRRLIRTMAVTAATAIVTATQLTTPAGAAVPSCLVLHANAPDRWSTYRDFVRASVAWSSYCPSRYVVFIELETKVCGAWGCNWHLMEGSSRAYTTSNGESAGMTSEAACRAGKHRYRALYGVRDLNGLVIHQDYTGDPEFECDEYTETGFVIGDECTKFCLEDIDPV